MAALLRSPAARNALHVFASFALLALWGISKDDTLGWLLNQAVWASIALVLWGVILVLILRGRSVGLLGSLVMVLAFGNAVLIGEALLRASPFNAALTPPSTTGYIRETFLQPSWSPERMWNSYLSRYVFPTRDDPEGYGWNEEVPLQKPEGELRVVCLGGSTTHAVGVARPEESFPVILEGLLRERTGLDVNVINAGWPGYTVLHDRLELERDILRLDPDVVTLYVGANDGFFSWWLGDALDAIWEQRQSGERSAVAEWLSRSRLAVAAIEYLGSFRSLPSRLERVLSPEAYARELRTIADLCEEHGIDLVLAHEAMADDLHLTHTTHDLYHEAMDAVAAERGLPVVDPRPLFRAHRLEGWFVDIVHPGPEGNAAIARLLAEAVEPLLQARVATD